MYSLNLRKSDVMHIVVRADGSKRYPNEILKLALQDKKLSQFWSNAIRSEMRGLLDNQVLIPDTLPKDANGKSLVKPTPLMLILDCKTSAEGRV